MVKNCYLITMRKDLYLSKYRHGSFCLLKKMLETYISYGSISVEYDFYESINIMYEEKNYAILYYYLIR